MPTKWRRENIVEFKNFKNSLEVPFIVYADIESLLEPVNNNLTSESALPKGATKKLPAISIGYLFLSRSEPSLSRYKTCPGPTCIEDFLQDMYELMRDVVWPRVQYVKPMVFSEEDAKSYDEQLRCHNCGNFFDFQFESGKPRIIKDKVRDHCHLSGRYRGAAHVKSNLK